jgi:hypothetical protein
MLPEELAGCGLSRVSARYENTESFRSSRDSSIQVACRMTVLSPPLHFEVRFLEATRMTDVALTKTSERLFAGIFTTSRSSRPWGTALATRSSTSRTPQRGSRLLRSASKAALDGAVCVPQGFYRLLLSRTP